MEFNFDFEMTKENKKMIEELLKQKGVKHYVLETKDKEKLNLVEYKDYEELEKENQQLKEFIKWLEEEIKEIIRNAGYHRRIGEDILEKYKEIIGGKNEN